ncbi:hypothetical protein BVY02_00265 [bacterium J17]|nr:hypothetical protein BVY02_00265 [bacterium J17]
MTADVTTSVTAEIITNRGIVRVELLLEEAPKVCANFLNLARRGFYNRLTFFRVVGDAFVQTGDPLEDGSGGPGYHVDAEFSDKLLHSAPGVLSMVASPPGKIGSQFIVTKVAAPWLNNRNPVFGRVLSGQYIIDTLRPGDFIKGVKIKGSVELFLSRYQEDIRKWDRILDPNYPRRAGVG